MWYHYMLYMLNIYMGLETLEWEKDVMIAEEALT